MTYDLRPAVDDGKACSTCRHATMRLDPYYEPWWQCSSAMTNVHVIRNPDENVCDGWEERP